MRSFRIVTAALACIAALTLGTAPTAAGDSSSDDTFTSNEIIQSGSEFFGVSTEAMAKAVQRVFRDL